MLHDGDSILSHFLARRHRLWSIDVRSVRAGDALGPVSSPGEAINGALDRPLAQKMKSPT